MKIIATPIEGLFVIQLEPRGDHRGYFMRTYDRQIAADHGLQTEWLQENQSLSGTPGTVRGLHFQRPPFAETKLVRALSGALLDVVVDVRRGSATYGQHFAVELTATNHKCLYIPKGFAHGFCTLQPNSILAYKVDQVIRPMQRADCCGTIRHLVLPGRCRASQARYRKRIPSGRVWQSCSHWMFNLQMQVSRCVVQHAKRNCYRCVWADRQSSHP